MLRRCEQAAEKSSKKTLKLREHWLFGFRRRLRWSLLFLLLGEQNLFFLWRRIRVARLRWRRRDESLLDLNSETVFQFPRRQYGPRSLWSFFNNQLQQFGGKL